MQKRVDIKIFAKINLSLNIVGLSGNMHLLDSVVASVSIFDAISISLREGGIINIEISDPSIDKNNNSATKAVAATKNILSNMLGSAFIPTCPSKCFDYSKLDFGADIIINKGIPIAAGLGGSSADAAGVILALDKLLGLSAGGVSLTEIATQTGSDTAYMLEGGYALMRGQGEKIEKINSDMVLNLVIAWQSEGSLTKNVYAEFDKVYPSINYCPSNNRLIKAALANNDLETLVANVDNALTKPAISLCPQIARTMNALYDLSPLAVFMTGSGSAVVGVFACEADAKSAANLLNGSSLKAIHAKTLQKGYIF